MGWWDLSPALSSAKTPQTRFLDQVNVLNVLALFYLLTLFVGACLCVKKKKTFNKKELSLNRTVLG